MTKNATAKENMARGRGGDMGDLAKIGQRFLKEPGTFDVRPNAGFLLALA